MDSQVLNAQKKKKNDTVRYRWIIVKGIFSSSGQN